MQHWGVLCCDSSELASPRQLKPCWARGTGAAGVHGWAHPSSWTGPAWHQDAATSPEKFLSLAQIPRLFKGSRNSAGLCRTASQQGDASGLAQRPLPPAPGGAGDSPRRWGDMKPVSHLASAVPLHEIGFSTISCAASEPLLDSCRNRSPTAKLINRVRPQYLINLMNPDDKIRVHLISSPLLWRAGETAQQLTVPQQPPAASQWRLGTRHRGGGLPCSPRRGGE